MLHARLFSVAILCKMAHCQDLADEGLAGSPWLLIHCLLGLGLESMALPARAITKNGEFKPATFLATIGEGRKNLTFVQKQGIFAQGDAADAVFYIQKGKVKLTVVSKTGREATIGMLRDGNFFGEGALAGQTLRMGSAAAMTDCEIQRIDKKGMMDALKRTSVFFGVIVGYF